MFLVFFQNEAIILLPFQGSSKMEKVKNMFIYQIPITNPLFFPDIIFRKCGFYAKNCLYTSCHARFLKSRYREARNDFVMPPCFFANLLWGFIFKNSPAFRNHRGAPRSNNYVISLNISGSHVKAKYFSIRRLHVQSTGYCDFRSRRSDCKTYQLHE